MIKNIFSVLPLFLQSMKMLHFLAFSLVRGFLPWLESDPFKVVNAYTNLWPISSEAGS